MRYIRRQDNPLIVKAFGAVGAGGLGAFDSAVYEEVEGELPEGWEQEVIPSLASLLKTIYEAQPIEVQLGFYSFVPQVLTALQNNREDIAKLIIEAATIPPELEPVRAEMLEVLDA